MVKLRNVFIDATIGIAMLLHCIDHSIRSSPTRLATCTLSCSSAQALIMEFSQDDGLRSAGDWSPPACSVRSGWGDSWVRMWAWEGECCWDVFDSFGSERMIQLTKIPISPYPISRPLPSRRRAAQRNRRRNCRRNWLRTVPAGSIAGSKRRIRETSFCHSVERLFCSRHSEGPSKKSRKSGHQIHHNSLVACSSDSNIRKSSPNSVGKDCDNPKTSASKSCEGNSQYLRFRIMSWMSNLVWVRRIVLTGELTRELSVMHMPSDLDSLHRNGGRNSLASANVRKLCDAFVNCCFRVREQSVSTEASSVKVIRKKATSTGWDSAPNDLREHIDGLPWVHRFWKRQQSVPSETITVGGNSKKPRTTWDSLPNDLKANILQRVDFRDLFRFKGVSTDWKEFIEGDAFRESRGVTSEGSFTGIHYYIKNQSWRCSGYDLHSKSWKALPPFSYLPLPDTELFKEYSVCGHGALMCADVSKLRKGELVVFNTLTGKKKALPPLLYPRNSVLLHISVDSLQKSYKVIVAGSTASSQNWRKPNCKIMEVFDSSTSEWKETCNIPGPSFGLSKHQTGVSVSGILFFISSLDAGYHHPSGDYVLAWDTENCRYLKNWVCPIPFVPDSKSLLQLVENDGKVYLFSVGKEDVQGPGIVCLCIDEMEFPDRKTGAMACQWRNVVEVRKTGVQEVCVYPDFRSGVADFLCVGFGKGKLCIFNTLDRDGVVYDMLDGMQCEMLEPPPANQTGDKFFSLNPASFTLHPSFSSDP